MIDKTRFFQARINSLNKLINKKADAVLITSAEETFYFTGLNLSGFWLLHIYPRTYVIANPLLYGQLTRYFSLNKLKNIEIKKTDKMLGTVKEILEFNKTSRVAINFQQIEHATFLLYRKKLPKILFVDNSNVITRLRQNKDLLEIRHIKHAGKIAKKICRGLQDILTPGISEKLVATKIDVEILKNGGIPAFDTIVASGPNSAYPHHLPTNRKICSNELIIVDFGVKYNGYCCDLTRTIVLGKINNLHKKMVTAVTRAYEAAIANLRSGVSAREIDGYARNVVSEFGFEKYFIHGTGHGVGILVHEPPTLSTKSADAVLENNVVTIEPGIYIPKTGGVRFENTVLVTKTGCAELT